MMYIHHMVRTQLYLDEDMHRRLTALARRQDRSLSELVREAVRQAYGPGDTAELRTTLRGIAGLWKDRTDVGAATAYVRRLRHDTRRTRRRND